MWQWGAAAYSKFDSTPGVPGFQAADYVALNVKPVDDNNLSQYKNSDHAGTPEGYTNYVIGGARGGGGSNFTGSWSGTISVPPTQGGTVVNTATVNATNDSNPANNTSSATITIQAP
jgi:hypothetical protein